MVSGGDARLNILLSLRDEASRKLSGFGGRLREFSGTARRAGLALSAFGAAGTVAITNFAQAALEQERAVNTLARVTEAAGINFESVRDQIEETTAALQRKTNFGDEQQIRVLAQLIPNIGDVDEALLALQATMEVATINNQELSTAARTMGRVFSGELDTVRGLSVNFEGLETAGERAEAIIAKVGGAAEANRNPFTQMGNAVGDVKEAFGRTLLPVLLPIIDKFRELLQWIQALNPTILKLVGITVLATTAVAAIGGPILLLVSVLPALITGLKLAAAGLAALGVAAGPVTLVIAGIAAAVAAGIAVWLFWNQIVEFVGKVFERVSSFILQLFRSNFAFILPGGILIRAILGLMNTWSSVWGTIQSIASNAWQRIRGIATFIVDSIVNIFAGTPIEAVWNRIWEGIKNVVIGAWNIIKDTVRKAIEIIVGIFRGELTFVDVWNMAWDAITTKASEAWERIKDLAQSIADVLGSVIGGAINRLGSVWQSIWNGITRAISAAWDTIRGIIDRMTSALDSVLDRLNNLPGAGVLGNIGGAIGGAASAAGGFLGFQRGGIVPGPVGAPVPALLHGGERVVPAGASGPVNISIVINAGDINTNLDFRREVLRALRDSRLVGAT